MSEIEKGRKRTHKKVNMERPYVSRSIEDPEISIHASSSVPFVKSLQLEKNLQLSNINSGSPVTHGIPLLQGSNERQIQNEKLLM
jgi:hypothetical protein